MKRRGRLRESKRGERQRGRDEKQRREKSERQTLRETDRATEKVRQNVREIESRRRRGKAQIEKGENGMGETHRERESGKNIINS